MNEKSQGREKVVKSHIPGQFDIQLDEKRLSFLISSFVSPVQGHECSVVSLRNMVNVLKMKYPGSWKDVLCKMINEVPDADQKAYLAIFEGRFLTREFSVLNLPNEPEEIVKDLFSYVEHPEFDEKLRSFFMRFRPDVLFFQFCYGDQDEFYKFVTLYYLYDSQGLFGVFKEYIDKTFENKPIEFTINYLTTHEKVLKIFPNGKLLHSLYSTLSKSLTSLKGAKQLAQYAHTYLCKNCQPPQIGILYILCGQKDQFEKFHSDFCIKRLLKSFNPSLELQTCELIQQLAGPDSMDIVISLINSAQSHQLSIPKMSVLITTQKNLTLILSPSQSLSDFTPSYLPPELNSLFSEYLSNFKAQFPHKTLNFFHHSGFLDLQYGSCSLTCNFTQACILLLFNQSQYNKKEDIIEKLQCSPIYKNIVLEEIESLMRVFEESELGLEVSLNEGSSIDLTQKEETEVEDVSDNMDEVRKPHIDCFVVKLLKNQKQMEIQALLEQMAKGLKFVPTEILVKERLKNLESRGFIWIVENTCGYVP